MLPGRLHSLYKSLLKVGANLLLATPLLLPNLGLRNVASQTNSPDFHAQPSWSPDGEQIAFVSNFDGQSDIWLVTLATLEARNLTQNSMSVELFPRWSPNGQYVAFNSLTTNSDFKVSELMVFNVESGELLKPIMGKDYVVAFQEFVWSPNGDALAFVATSMQDGNRDIWITNISGDEQSRITSGDGLYGSPAWLSETKLGFITSNGRLALLDLETEEQIDLVTRDVSAFDIAPDGTSIAYITVDWLHSEMTVSAMNLDDFTVVDFGTYDSQFGYDIVWSPDSRKFIFLAGCEDGGLEIWLTEYQANESTRLTGCNGSLRASPTWSPDSQRIAFQSVEPDRSSDIWILNVETLDTTNLTDSIGKP